MFWLSNVIDHECFTSLLLQALYFATRMWESGDVRRARAWDVHGYMVHGFA